MKHFFVLFFSMMSANLAFAGPISSGGIPETDFQHDRAAIQTILDTDGVLSLLKHKGNILSIASIDRSNDVYVVSTVKCELHVKFERTCKEKNGHLQCDYSSKVLLDESHGDCSR